MRSLDRWPTPRRLQTALAALVVLTSCLVAAGEATLGRGRWAIRTLGRDAAPSIELAEAIYASLADFDASAGDALLMDSGRAEAAEAAMARRRSEVTARIIDAAENITYGDAEKVPVVRIADGWTAYLQMLAAARSSGAPTARRDAYLAASAFLHAEIVPAALALDAANRAALDRAYEDVTRSGGRSALLIAFGVASAAVLIALQVWLVVRVKRVFNPALVVATTLTVSETAQLGAMLDRLQGAVRAAKNDAFESIHALRRARALAGDARGEEGRWLLEPTFASGYEVAFERDVEALAGPPPATSPETVTGLFGDELRNVSDPGERIGAELMVSAFVDYLRSDQRLRDLERSGKHTAAVELRLGTSREAFARFDGALRDVLAINQREFERVLSAADTEATRWQRFLPVFGAVIALAAFAGVRPRLREYGA